MKRLREKKPESSKGVPVFFDGSDERSSRVIEETAENVEAPWYKMEKDALKIQEITDKHIAFLFWMSMIIIPYGRWPAPESIR